MTIVPAERLGVSLDSENTQYGRDGAPYVDAIPILDASSIEGAEGVMALDLAGMARVIVERIFNRYELVKDINGDFVKRGIYEEGFCDRSELYYVHQVCSDDGREGWELGNQVAIGGLDKQIGELVSRLSQLRAADNLLTPVRAARFAPGSHPSIGIYGDGEMQLLEGGDLVRPENAGTISSSGGSSVVEIGMNGLTHMLASPESVERICLGPEDPTIVTCSDGAICMFITLAVQSASGSWRFETLMAKGPSITELEAVDFVPLGMMKELCFGPEYEDSGRRMVLGEGSLTGYSTGCTATVGADFALDSFRDEGLVSLFPPNVRDRFAYYAGSTDTPEDHRHRWLGEHISPNKVIDEEVIPLFDGWHAVMTSGRSQGDDGATYSMGPFEVGIVVMQLNPSHPYAGQCIWADDRPLFHARGAESITFGSDWYIKDNGTEGLDRTIVFIVHRDDKDVCAIEMPLRNVWNRVPEFLRNGDADETARAAAAVIGSLPDLNIEKRHREDFAAAS